MECITVTFSVVVSYYILYRLHYLDSKLAAKVTSYVGLVVVRNFLAVNLFQIKVRCVA